MKKRKYLISRIKFFLKNFMFLSLNYDKGKKDLKKMLNFKRNNRFLIFTLTALMLNIKFLSINYFYLSINPKGLGLINEFIWQLLEKSAKTILYVKISLSAIWMEYIGG
jgi:hypothetical protein